MATQIYETPGGIAFAGFYHPEIYRELLAFLRTHKDRLGLTDENVFEVHTQLLSAFANVGHLNNCRLDTVATELFIDSAQLLESVKRLLRLIGIELRSASPAVADMVARLSEVSTVDVTGFIPALSEFATESTPPISYEAPDTGLDLQRGDQVGHVYGLEKTGNGTGSVSSAAPGVFTLITGPDFAPVNEWPTDAVGQHLFVSGSQFDNGGEFRVTERINTTQIRVVRIPDSQAPGFLTETGGTLLYSLKKFTADLASQANTNGLDVDPWTDVEAGDFFYVGHPQVLPTRLDLEFKAASFGAGIKGVWEYFDNQRSALNPQSVTDNGSTLTFDLEPLLGSEDRSGAEITVTFLQTGTRETVTSVFASGENRITTSGLLGQVNPSTDVLDYLITADWVPFENQADTTRDTPTYTSDFTQDGDVQWDLPQTRERSWISTDVNLVEALWLRYRAVEVSTPTEPTINRIRIDGGDQYITFQVTQGETVDEQTIGSSTGQVSQEFNLPETPYLDDTELIEVDELGGGNWVEYTRVDTFLQSGSTSRHYIRETDAQDKAKVIFGDGANGKIPPAGVGNIRASYRIGGDVNGNVGEDQIIVNADGVNGLAEVYNPRSAVGWRIKDGGDTTDLARVKRDSPAQLRVRGVAVTPDDAARLAIDEFTDSSGIKPVARAYAEEEGFGIKTIKLLVVGIGGTTLSSTQLADLDTYFNGDRNARPQVEGVLVMNHQLTSVNFQPILVSIDATVVWSGGSAEQVRNALQSFLTPLALQEDGTTFVWDFGANVSYSRIHELIHQVDPNITDVRGLQINGLAQSLSLGPDELPVTTASNLTINIVES